MEEEVLRQLEQIIGHNFSNRELLAQAFTHSSSVEDRSLSNERQEFLGDSVLALVICRALFERTETYLEGELTKMKSMLVSRKTCAKIARRLGLHKFLRVGKGMADSPSLSHSLAAGVFEAVIAALFLDAGLAAAEKFLLTNFGSLIKQADKEYLQGNFKSLLQQYTQQYFNTTPAYELIDEKGPDHNKCFEARVTIDGRHYPSGWGTNKKQAEQKAALNALVELGVLDAGAEELVGE